MAETYRQEWFTSRQSAARRSANPIVAFIRELVRPASVVDLGCGTGSWLAAFEIEDVLGVDGDWVPGDLLEIPADRFLRHDLREPLHLGRGFDLALSIETGEHLPEGAADQLVSELTALAPVVLFSAAIPWQGGTGHANPQWPDWWAAKFNERDFAPVDCVRPRFWAHPDVRFFHAQNLILYVVRDRLESVGLQETPVLRLVHPRLLERLMAPKSLGPRLRQAFRRFQR